MDRLKMVVIMLAIINIISLLAMSRTEYHNYTSSPYLCPSYIEYSNNNSEMIYFEDFNYFASPVSCDEIPNGG